MGTVQVTCHRPFEFGSFVNLVFGSPNYELYDLRQLLNFYGPQFSHLKNGNNKRCKGLM